jgi:AcrR family transcriptional regulator
MRESKAKQKILQVAETLIPTVGYSGLNVNTVAEEAGVSIGTLYYHFPEGKVSILLEMRQQISTRYEVVLRERIGEGFVESVSSFDEGLEKLLDVLIMVHREGRLVLAAMESMVLGNLGAYDELAAEIDVDRLKVEDARLVLGVLEALLDGFPEPNLSLDNGVRTTIIIDMLIHRFIYAESVFGSEQEFKQMMKNIINSLLTSN